jgi:hypothetical protein
MSRLRYASLDMTNEGPPHENQSHTASDGPWSRYTTFPAFRLALPAAFPYNEPVDSEATVLFEMEKELWSMIH